MLEIGTSIGIKMVVTYFVTQFTHVFRHFGVLKYCLGKTVLKIWSKIFNIAYVFTKILLEKSEEKKP